MSISLISATPTAPNVVQVRFSEAFNQDSALFERSHYAFKTRFGFDVPIYAASVYPTSTVLVDVTLQEAMLNGGVYELTVNGVSAISDGIPIQDGAGPNTANFTGVGQTLKCVDIKKRVPSWWDKRYGSDLNAILCATGAALELLAGYGATSGLKDAAAALSRRTATGKDLGVIGANFGVSRPEFLAGDDEAFRALIPILGTKRKAVLSIFYDLLENVFGSSTTAGWRVFEIQPNVLTIELPSDLFYGLAPATLDSATYLHDGDAGTATSVGPNNLTDSTKNWIIDRWIGSILVDSASTEFTISSNNATSLTISGTPAAGAYTILVPDTISYPGDYFCVDEIVDGSTVGDNIIVLFQQTVIADLTDKLKASGIQIDVVIRE